MLQRLVIKNYAIIDNLEMMPDARLNTITGETGAGKSIILGALALILGERADTSVVMNTDEKTVVEGYFDVTDNERFKKAIADAELDYEPLCIVRREISGSGKSRAFINDTPVTLSVLHKLTALLVDLHQQFGHLALEDDSFQMETLDAISDTTADAAQYRQLYFRHKKIKQKLADNRERQQQWQRDADYKHYLLRELEEANFKPDEIEETELLLRQMNNAEKIKSVLEAGRELLTDGEAPITGELRKLTQQLQGIVDVLPGLKPIHERINSAYEDLKDVSAEIEEMGAKVYLDPEEMETLQQRMDMGYKLLKKHGMRVTAELLLLKEKLQEELRATLDINEAIERLAHEEGQLYHEMTTEAASLTLRRREAIKPFVLRINELLALVGMPNARFEIKMEAGTPATHGADEVQFMLDANKSGQFLALQKAASGGEMSRIMLCLKSLTARALHMPTLIFDEVDMGISGEAARQVGVLLRNLSQYHQVICITHQPQVAARGTAHFFVYKEADSKGRLSTKIRTLKPDDRILAIARMIGGEIPSEAAISNARELVSQTQ